MLDTGRSLDRYKNGRFLPAFLFSHRLTAATASPPGEALGAPAPLRPQARTERNRRRRLLARSSTLNYNFAQQ